MHFKSVQQSSPKMLLASLINSNRFEYVGTKEGLMHSQWPQWKGNPVITFCNYLFCMQCPFIVSQLLYPELYFSMSKVTSWK
eukprot:1160394-Pelagomonas_calceolata.AAC.3